MSCNRKIKLVKDKSQNLIIKILKCFLNLVPKMKLDKCQWYFKDHKSLMLIMLIYKAFKEIEKVLKKILYALIVKVICMKVEQSK